MAARSPLPWDESVLPHRITNLSVLEAREVYLFLPPITKAQEAGQIDHANEQFLWGHKGSQVGSTT